MGGLATPTPACGAKIPTDCGIDIGGEAGSNEVGGDCGTFVCVRGEVMSCWRLELVWN